MVYWFYNVLCRSVSGLISSIFIGSFAAQTPEEIERCVELTEITIIVDLICNIFFLWRFVVMVSITVMFYENLNAL